MARQKKPVHRVQMTEGKRNREYLFRDSSGYIEFYKDNRYNTENAFFEIKDSGSYGKKDIAK